MGLITSGGALVVEPEVGLLLEPSGLRIEAVRCLYKCENLGLLWRVVGSSGGSIMRRVQGRGRVEV
jgi:hypothetical protein